GVVHALLASTFDPKELIGPVEVLLGGVHLHAGGVDLPLRVRPTGGQRRLGILRQQRQKLEDGVALLHASAGSRNETIRDFQRPIERSRNQDGMTRWGRHFTAEGPGTR